MTRVTVAVFLVVTILLAWLIAPAFRVEPPDPAIENGIRAAKSAIRHRQLATAALAGRDSAIRDTDAAFRLARARLREFRFAPVESLTVQMDSSPRPIVGSVIEGDTLISLRLARIKVVEIVATADSLITGLQAVVMVERGRSSLAIQHLEATIAAQDTVIAGLKAEIRAKTKPWYRRAVSGVVHATAAATCGTAGYVLGGPVGGIGSAVTCAALAGIFR